ncbi:hypothetical protein, partial [Pseudomonas sp. C2B4]|uniref:hypothetical protein n=1 Tax=Pseudomonas sp. C2B4 TaxID=2735270 RepID=UPI001586897A
SGSTVPERSGVALSFCGRRVSFDAIASTASLLDAAQEKNLILKSHDLDEMGITLLKIGAMKGVCTIRDPFEAIESWMEVFGFSLEQSMIDFGKWLKTFQSIQQDVLVLRFDLIQDRPIIAIWKIARYLGFTLSPMEFFRLWKSYQKKSISKFSNSLSANSDETVDIGFSYYDKENFFHRRHVRLNKTIKLSSSEREQVLRQVPGFSEFYNTFFS